MSYRVHIGSGYNANSRALMVSFIDADTTENALGHAFYRIRDGETVSITNDRDDRIEQPHIWRCIVENKHLSEDLSIID